MENKYIGINKKTPHEAAKIVGDIERLNYLAHSIREIEHAILRTQRKHYHIISRATAAKGIISEIIFYDCCCEICIPSGLDGLDNKRFRLALSHELGHLIFNIDRLKDPELLENNEPSDDEEIFAWEFAYHLVYRKSEHHKNSIEHKEFVYESAELKRTLSKTLKEIKDGKPNVYTALMSSLNLPSV